MSSFIEGAFETSFKIRKAVYSHVCREVLYGNVFFREGTDCAGKTLSKTDLKIVTGLHQMRLKVSAS